MRNLGALGARISVATLLSALAVSQVACGGAASSTEEPALDDGGLPQDDTAPADTSPADTTPPPDAPGCSTAPGCGPDTDCDGIPDSVEGRMDPGGPVDTDGDGTPDYLDDDSDGDGIPDALEWKKSETSCDPLDEGNDADGDGVPNFRSLDADGNGIPDKDELCPPADVLVKLGMPACDPKTPYDFDGDGVPDFLDFDNDHDSAKSDKSLGLADKIELTDASGKFIGLVDTDKDGIPDLYDVDSDGDFIPDLEDGITDDDGDGVPAFRDLDSDGDGVPDACEARGKASASAADLMLPLVDTDKDGTPDFRDLDSDGDFLPDGKEDVDGSCTKGAGETDRLNGDSDGDGHLDFVETELTPIGSPSWALDPSKNPSNQGKFYFVVPYSADGSAKPSPTSTPLALSTTLNQGDVAFMVDSTNSMRGIQEALASSIADTIIPALKAKLTDLQLGVVAYDDALVSPFGQSTDSFIWFPNGGDASKGSRMTSVTADAINAAKGLNKTSPGGSFPEGSLPALWWVLTGDAMSFGTGVGAKSFPGVTPPADRFGGLHFRKEALPIVIQASDANMHGGKTTGCKLYPQADSYVIPDSLCFPIAYTPTAAKPSSLSESPDIDDVAGKLKSLGAKYIGISVHGPGGSYTGRSSSINRTLDASYYEASVDMLYLARQTASKVPPSVLKGTSSDCKTSAAGATTKNPADVDGLCPLVFDVRYDGGTLSDAVVNAVVAMVDAIKFDVHVRATPIVEAGVDPVDAFLANVLPMPAGGTDPVTGATCQTFAASATEDRFSGPKAATGKDGAKETILDLTPGPLYCFAVTPKPNTTVPSKTTTQTFRATLRALGEKPAPPAGPGGGVTLGSDREVLFIVPPTLN